jgi:hypothetical protein
MEPMDPKAEKKKIAILRAGNNKGYRMRCWLTFFVNKNSLNRLKSHC